jgi:hypothetical protein
MEQQIERRVIGLTKATKDSIVDESGIQSSLTEEDMKRYLDMVIREIKSEKEKGSAV